MRAEIWGQQFVSMAEVNFPLSNSGQTLRTLILQVILVL